MFKKSELTSHLVLRNSRCLERQQEQQSQLFQPELVVWQLPVLLSKLASKECEINWRGHENG